MMRSWIINFVLAAFILGCTNTNDSSQFHGEITREDVIQRISINGTLRGLRQAQIQAAYPGYVGKVYVKVGQAVRAGDPLVSVLQTISQPLSQVFPVRSPFGGVVTQILKREGEYVTASGSADALILVDDLSKFWVTATVPEVDIAKLQVGQEALIKANALPDRIFKGVVRAISLSPRQSTDRWDRGRVEYPIEVEVNESSEQLLSGMTVVVDVISAKAEGVPTVRHEFLRRDRDGYFVVDDQDQSHRIEIGLSNEELVEIKKGPPLGTKIKLKDFAGDKRATPRRR